MGCSRIDYNGETLMDISGDTVTEDTLAQGSTAHNSNGEPIVGKAVFGGGAVTSVNGKTGAVVLSAEDIPHTHSWDEIENKPGEVLASYLFDALIHTEKNNCWYQHFSNTPDVVLGETVRVKIKLSGSDSFYERDCKVLSEDGFGYGISFNNSAYSEESINNGSYAVTAVPIDSGVPSLLLRFAPGGSCGMNADKDYTGAYVEIVNITVKLGNEALYVTDKATEGSDYLITSGGVFDALSSAGGGGSSDVLMIPCYLLLSRMQIRAENDQLIVTTQDIVEAFNSNKAIYLKVDVMQFVAEDDKPHMNFSYVIMPLTQCASTKSTDQYIMAFDGLLTVNGVPHIINCSLNSNSSAGDVTMFPLATLS